MFAAGVLTVLVPLTWWLVFAHRELAKRVEALEIASLETARECPHNEVTNVGTFGLPEYRCEQCGAMVSDEHES